MPPPGHTRAGPVATSNVSPAAGTYSYAITGHETATGFGRRDFPATMTVAVHGDPSIAANEVVLDLHFSDQHNEREVLGYVDESVALDYEAGSITFGPMTQTSEADYAPPIPQVVSQLRSGTSAAKNSDGSVGRTEDWTATPKGTEDITVEGRVAHCAVVEVDRKTRPGSSDQETRKTTYWYDPSRRLWVKWSVTMHGERAFPAFTFTYDEEFTAS